MWLSMAIAFFLFALTALVDLLKSIPDLEIFENIEVLFLIVGATILSSTLCHYRKERNLAKDGKNGKLKEKDGKRYEEMERWLEGI